MDLNLPDEDPQRRDHKPTAVPAFEASVRQEGAGKGKRLVLADSGNLFDKIDLVRGELGNAFGAVDGEQMRKHIAELEAAIAALQQTSPSGLDERQLGWEDPSSSDERPECLSGLFGTLTLGEKPHFFGPNAASDYLLFRKAVFHDSAPTKSSPFSVEILRKGPCLLPADDPRSKRKHYMEVLRSVLPPKPVAWKLTHVFLYNTAWMFGGARADDVALILNGLYSDHHDEPRAVEDVTIGAHDVAVLFVIFAFSCILNPDAEPRMDDARKYYDLATIALQYDHVLRHPTVSAIRALHLMTWFLHFQDDQNSMCVAYTLMGLTAQLCKTLGMHLNDSAWELDEREKQSRRLLVWDIIYYNSWGAESMGRPPSFSLAQFNARLPIDNGAYFDESGEWQQSYSAWAHSFTNLCLLRALAQAFGVRGASHATVMRLDRIIREHPVGPALRLRPGAACDGLSIAAAMQRANTTILSNKLLLYLHRGFFALAVAESPEDPLQSRYADSVTAAFRSAFIISTTARAIYKQIPFYERFVYIWSSVFSSAVILVSVVIKSPGSHLSPCAWAEFEVTFRLLEKISHKSRTISRAMPSLRQLREKASANRGSYSTSNSRGGSPPSVDLDEIELAFIYGQTHCAPGRSGAPGETALHWGIQPAPLAPSSSLEASAVPSYEMNDAFWANLGLTTNSGLAEDPILPVTAARDQHNLNATWAGFMDDMGVVDGFGFEEPPRA
ncbi:hypothetical protein AURDEDRAFT_179478 [Auricularia subglabra TFB-10046 SS5]|nr:hypothetical protein AURDEDRAFT_179478 [Auricularia subglabra TFB-10046 SS5]